MKRTPLARKAPMHRKEPSCDKSEHARAKEKTCTHCKNPFQPARPMQKVCGPICARRKVEADKKAERVQTRARKEAIKRLPDLHREAQKAFNQWVRARDEKQPCISCGAPPPNLSDLHAGRDAGHYRSVGSAPQLRYHEDNVHAQCVHCNQWGAGKAVEYRIGLIARIGIDRVEALESQNEAHKWIREELITLKATYRAKRKELERDKS